MFRFWKRKRQIHDPIIKIWVKWFVDEVPRRDVQLTTFPELQNILQNIPNHEFIKPDIHQESKKPERLFFAKLFSLDEPIEKNNVYDQITLFLNSCFKSNNKNDKELLLFIPFVFRYMIHYMYQFESLYTSILDQNIDQVKNKEMSSNDEKFFIHYDHEDATIILQNFEMVLELLLRFPEHLEDLFQILNPLFEQFQNFFHRPMHKATENLFINNFNSKILKIFLNYTSEEKRKNLLAVSDTLMPIFNYYVNYYQFWVMNYGSANFLSEFVADCSDISNNFINFPPEFARRNYDNIISPMLQTGFNFLGFIYLSSNQNNSDQESFNLGLSFLCFLYYIGNLGPKFAQSLWKHQMLHLIVTFPVWALDHFNFISFEITTSFDEIEMSLISPDFQKSLELIDPPVFTFITDRTFPSHLVIKNKPDKLNDTDQMAQYAFTGVHEMIKSQPELKKIMDILISFKEFHSLKTFLSIFTGESLNFARKYLATRGEKDTVKPKSNPLLLSAEISFFTIQLLSNMPIKKVSKALSSINGFKLLISNYAFRLQHNMWTSTSDSEDLGFFCLIRNSIFRLLSHCFVDTPEYAPDVLTAVSEIFQNSSPQMADEANKFFSILFKYNPNAFLEAMRKTNICEILVKYQMRLQSMQINIINNKIDSKFIDFVGQSRVQSLHLVDIFLTDNSTCCFLFCSSEFVKMLFHFLFEPMTQEFALNLIGRGLHLDYESFDHKTSDILYDNLFSTIKDLFKESLLHKDDKQWIHLIIIFLQLMRQVLSMNRKSLLKSIDKFKFMEDSSRLPSIASDIESHMKIVNCVLKCYVPILQANVKMQKCAAHAPLTNILKEISGLSFGNETIDILLQIVFEQDISLSNLPKQAEIHNQKMIPFLHECTKHLEQHPIIFDFIASICSPSITNKLKVFRSKMPITIIQYIQSFPINSEINSTQRKSINALLNLFVTVSSFVFQWKTFFASIQSMRPVTRSIENNSKKETYRSWWTTDLISCFIKIVSTPVHKSPSSFFHFDGRHTGITLPTINCSYLQNGLTFMIRFELSAVWGLPTTKPRLLSFVTSSNQRLEIYFDYNKLVVEYQKNDRAPQIKCSPDEVFMPNHWYHLAITINNSSIIFYINGSLSQIYTLKRALKLDGKIENGRIANITTVSSKLQSFPSCEMPLIFNMNCIYLFRISLSPETIALMAKLPIDFVYSFSPSPSNMYSDIPQECLALFSESIDNNLVFCYNARMTVDNECANLARNNVGNANVRAHIIPFSTSFSDVTTNIGGLKTFLPLFKQIDLPIEKEDNNHATDFLTSLIGLFSEFCHSSETIQAEFVNSDGFKCLADIFLTINKPTFQKKVINQLVFFYNILKADEYKIAMARDFWFNFTLWKHTSNDIQQYVISNYKSRLFKDIKDQSLMKEVTSVRTFLLLIYNQENNEIRNKMWEFVDYLASLKFTSQDQELFFKFAFIEKRNTTVHLEVLQHMYNLMNNQVSNFNRIIEKHEFLDEFIKLFNSPSEEVRIRALDFMIMFYKQESNNVIAKFPRGIDIYFLKCIPVFNHHELTEVFWEKLLNIYFDKDLSNSSKKILQGALLPLICHLSIYYDTKFVRNFLNELSQSLIFNEPGCDSLANCNNWFLWLFHIMIQGNRPKVYFGADETMIEIFSKVCLTILRTDKIFTKFGDIFSFMLSLQFSKMWNTTLFLREILCRTLKLINYENILTDQICLSVLTEVFNYLFYISSTEPYYWNVQLNSLHEREFIKNLDSETDGNAPLSNLLDIFGAGFTQQLPSLTYHFSARVTPDGEWLDKEVALDLCRLLVTGSKSKTLIDTTFQFFDAKFKVSEMFSFILGFLIRCDPSLIDESINLFNSIFSDKNSSSSDIVTPVHLFSLSIYRVSIKKPERIPQFIDFLQKYKKLLPNSLQSIIEKQKDIFSKGFTRDFNELVRDTNANYFSALNERSSFVAKQTKIRLEALNEEINKINEEINKMQDVLKAPKTDDQFLSSFKEENTLFAQEVQRQRVLCTKASKRIMRDLYSNGGPWCISGSVEHLKLWQICDTKFKRVFMKPNLKFDLHKMASLLRDESTEESANIKYERWLSGQNLVPQDQDDFKKADSDSNSNETKSYSFSTAAQLITISKILPYDGTFFMNNHEICFNGSGTDSKSVQFFVSDIEMVLWRSYLHIDSGLEFFLTTKKSYFIYFSKGDRQKVINFLKKETSEKTKSGVIIQSVPGSELIGQKTELWKTGKMSNYEYLMYLNLYSGRSFNDLSQYPVFPWILSDYTSETIDLNNPNIYRDLSKPVGALNEERLKRLIQDYKDCDPTEPYKCLYRFHYSNPFYVLLYLSRLEPFTTAHIELQGGKFDKANRMFRSIGLSYQAVTSLNNDFREIIPEFFTLPDFLVNANHFDLGEDEITHNRVDDVILPPWAKNADDFIRIHRAALESPYVSSHLNEWIDLIFGCNQSGQNAIKHNNTFHAYCYSSSVTPDVKKNNEKLREIQNHTNAVGIIPGQLFPNPHPERLVKPPFLRNVFGKSVMSQIAPDLNPLAQLSSAPKFITIHEKTMYILTSNLKFCSLAIPIKSLSSRNNSNNLYNDFSKDLQNLSFQVLGSIDQLLIIPSNSEITSSKSYAYIHNGYFASSSIWDNSFHIFKVEQTSLTFITSQRQKHSLIANLVCAGNNLLLTSWRDSSLTLWNLTTSHQQQIPLYRVTPHLTSLVDIDVNPQLRIIGSLDKSRKFILSDLSSGRYIRAFELDGNDDLNKVMLISNGYIVVASKLEASDRSSATTIIRVFGLNTNQISEQRFNGRLDQWCKVELECGFDGIAFSIIENNDNKLYFLELPFLDVVFQKDLTLRKIVSINCVSEYLMLIITDSEGKIYYIDLD